MLYVVTGENHETGAKTRIEIEAANRAAAERAARKSGVEVLHCHAVDEDPVAHPHVRKTPREEICEGGSCTKLIAVGGLILVALLVWMII